MEGELREVAIGDIGSVTTGKTPSTKSSEYFGGDIPFVTPRDLADAKFVRETERYLTTDGAASVKGAIVPQNSVMVSCIGSDMGKVAITGHRCVTNQQINSLTVAQDVCADFIYYVLKTRKQEFLMLAGGGSALPILNKSQFSKIKLLLPPLPEQKAIARILSSLDDKIELNRRMNATLEQMAQALFRAWFVDFEPVKAKAAGLQPTGMDAQTAALFPSELVESELGLVPKGWGVGTLDEVCTVRRNNVHPSNVSSDMPYVGLEHVPQKSIGLMSWGVASDVDSTKARFQKGDILFGKLRPYFHKVVVAPVDGICSTDILVLQAKVSCDFAFLLGHASGSELIDYATRVSNGARMPRVGWKDLAVYPIVLPREDIREKYNEIVEGFIMRIQANAFESQTLVQLRDSLLPRLISGRLHVPDNLIVGLGEN